MPSGLMNNICVIIPMHNFGWMTNDCIEITLKNAGVPVDIHVVDDGSKEPFVNNSVTVHRLDKNVGFTNAINHGILQCWGKYKYIHFLNNDTAPYPDFIKRLFDVLDKNPDIGIAGSVREVFIENVKYLETWPIDLFAGWTTYIKEELKDEFYHCPWIPLCSTLIKTETVQATGLFDRRMRTYCTDNDFCMRAGQLGYKTVLVPKSVVFHMHEVTTKSLKLDPSEDQPILLEKIRGDYMKDLLEHFPLDSGTGLRGKLGFTTYDGDK